MSYAVAPAGTAASEVRVVVQYPLIDIAEYQLAFIGAKDCHCYDPDVAVIRLRFVVNAGLMT